MLVSSWICFLCCSFPAVFLAVIKPVSCSKVCLPTSVCGIWWKLFLLSLLDTVWIGWDAKPSLSVFKTKQNHLNQQSPATFLLSLLVVPARWKACSGLGKTGMPEQQLRNSYWGFLAGRVSLLPTPSYSLMVTRFLCFRVCSAAFKWDWGAVGVCSQIFLFVTVSSAALQTRGKALGVSSHFRSVAMGFLRYLCFGFLPGVKAKIRTRTRIKEHKDDNCFTGDVPS